MSLVGREGLWKTSAPEPRKNSRTMPVLDHPLIDRFLDALWLEKGLSPHTRAAYRSDLGHFHAWLQARGVALEEAGRDSILDHLGWRLEQGYKARATARLLSGLRGFYR